MQLAKNLKNHFTYENYLTSPSFTDLKINLAEVFTFPLTAEELKLFEIKESPAKYASN